MPRKAWISIEKRGSGRVILWKGELVFKCPFGWATREQDRNPKEHFQNLILKNIAVWNNAELEKHQLSLGDSSIVPWDIRCSFNRKLLGFIMNPTLRIWDVALQSTVRQLLCTILQIEWYWNVLCKVDIWKTWFDYKFREFSQKKKHSYTLVCKISSNNCIFYSEKIAQNCI